MERIDRVVQHLSSAPAAGSTSRVAVADTTPVKICVTGAAGNIGYAVVFMIAQGQALPVRSADPETWVVCFPHDTDLASPPPAPPPPPTPPSRAYWNEQGRALELILLDIPRMKSTLDVLKMELIDCAFPLLTKIVVATDAEVAFKDVDVALLIGAMPRGKGMLRSDLMKANTSIFEAQGRALNRVASRDVRVVVVGNPANTNCWSCMQSAPDLNPRNFTALTRLDLNRAKSMIANRLGVPSHSVGNVIIWGNHSKTQFPDVRHAVVRDFPVRNISVGARAAIDDDEWLNTTFIKQVQERGSAIIKIRQKSSAASAADAIVNHVHDWMLGTAPGVMVSMGVLSDGSYNVPRGIIFSFPVTCADGEYTIVQGLPIGDFAQLKMDATAAELVDERHGASEILATIANNVRT